MNTKTKSPVSGSMAKRGTSRMIFSLKTTNIMTMTTMIMAMFMNIIMGKVMMTIMIIIKAMGMATCTALSIPQSLQPNGASGR